MSLLARPFCKLLVANRGEIAVRVVRTAREMGYRTVAVFSEADADAPHVALADEAVCIGPPPAAQSYLDMDALMRAAHRTGADALHPGYGFLAEHPELAQRCADEGIVFVGPPPEAMRLMGDKARAKRQMIEAGVPVIPGYQGGAQDAATLQVEAGRLGFPLLIKAAGGGGGRGMRVAREAPQLPQLLSSARTEALSAFGSGDLLLERLLEQARHVEIQVFADTQGHVIHLGERECSVQRRHQKIIEESPSPAVDRDLRQRMGDTAVAAAQAIGYVNAGTVELMLCPDGAFYFLEMNTRLQVEHPVTEMVTGLDLVRWQLLVASGEPLPLSQEQVVHQGHAMEARLYAEDPCSGFLPRTGRVLMWRAVSEGARTDAGVQTGQQIDAHYDPMLAKIIAHGASRQEARRRLLRAVEDTVLLGLQTNRQFLADLLRDPAFVAGEITTDTIDGSELPPRLVPPESMWALAALLRAWPMQDPWHSAGHAGWPVTLQWEEATRQLQVTHVGQGRYRVDGMQQLVELTVAAARKAGLSPGGLSPGPSGGEPRSGAERSAQYETAGEACELRCVVDGVVRHACFVPEGDLLHLQLDGVDAIFREPPVPRQRAVAAAGSGRVLAPMAGKLLALDVEPGDAVQLGQRVAVLEAMKMEHQVTVPLGGRVARVLVQVGEQVSARQLLLELELESEAT